jgi:AraC-like DNA-binding protein
MGFPERDRTRMTKLLSVLQTQDGAQRSRIEGVTLLRATRSTEPVPVLYEPCVVIVAQGSKRFHLPDRVLTYDARNYFLLTVPVPAECETIAGRTGPFLGFAVRIDLAMISDVLMNLGPTTRAPRKGRAELRVTAPLMNSSLSNVALRLVESLGSQQDSQVLGAQLVRELMYRVLSSEDGSILEDLMFVNEGRTRIHRILHRIHDTYALPLDVSTLAHEAGMSSSGLHLQFKAVTGSSPVQYQKTLRLHKARMLMVQESIGASIAAHRVGYESPSQFSREFKRLFGAPPVDEAQRVKAVFGYTDEVSASR